LVKINPKTRRLLEWSFKAGVSVLLLLALSDRLLKGGALASFGAAMNEGVHWRFLFAALVLMPLNWGLEMAKWWRLAGRVPGVSGAQALKGLLIGVSFSLFTPNRIGEHGGKVLAVAPHCRGKILVASLAGSYCQLVALVGGGILGLWRLGRYYGFASYSWFLPLQIGALTLMLSLAAGLYWLPRTGLPWLQKASQGKSLSRWIKPLEVLSFYNGRILLAALSLALLRYGVYCSQYYLLLRFFGLDLPPDLALGGIGAIFFIQTGVPLPPLGSVLARGELALLFWGAMEVSELSILAATYGIFIINLFPVALLGLGVLLRINTLKSSTYASNADANRGADRPHEHSHGFQ